MKPVISIILLLEKSEYIYNEKVLVESQQSKQLATVAIPKKQSIQTIYQRT